MQGTLPNFIEMIDEYPAMCAEQGIEPNKPPAEIMVPIPTKLYVEATYKANHDNVPIKTIMENAIQSFVAQTI